MVAVFALSLCLYCLIVSCSCSIAVVEGPSRVRSKLPSIEQLQSQGYSYLSRKKYQSASYCFSAILQLAQGSLEPEQLRDRRHCGLQLAQCEFELGNDHKAIARCCEVISETPDVVPSIEESQSYVFHEEYEWKKLGAADQLTHDLGRAYFLRGVCLKRIGQPHMALQDLEIALQYLPDEIQIHSEISALELEKESVEKRTGGSITHTVEPAVSGDKTGPLQADTAVEQREELLEECMLQHPSLVFSNKQLRRLAKKSQPVTVRPLLSSAHHASHSPSSPLSPLSSSLDLSSMLGFGSPLGGVNSEISGSSGGTGVGGLMGALDKLVSFAPLICSLTGVHPDTARTIVNTLATVSKAYASLQSAYAAVRARSDFLAIALCVVWLAATVHSYRKL